VIPDINSPITRIVIIICMIALLTISLFAVREMEDSKEDAKTETVVDE
jgi:Sec-independent protein secretion pathway component TatC